MGRDCYDPIEKKLFSLNGGEITTSSRFSPFENDSNMKEVLQVKRMPDSHPEQNKRTPRKVYFRDQEDFILKMKNDSFCSSKCLNNEYNACMLNNKYNFCSGYFPEYVLIPNVNRQLGFNSVLINDLNSKHFNDNIDLNLDYYPDFHDGNYTKQLSNMNSKYNNFYFYKMKSIYKICKKFLETSKNAP